MPELPEVEVVRAGVARHVTGATLGGVEILGRRVARRHLLGNADLTARLLGREVQAVRRRGKYLWLDLSPAPAPEALVVHLGMSGQLLVADADRSRARHQHATFDLVGGAAGAGRQLRFVDQRTFGGLALVDVVPDPFAPTGSPATSGTGVAARDGAGRPLVPATIAHIAPDPFEPAFDPDRVQALLRRRQSAVKRSLLDQGLVSGIGNIYADEALWRARLHGERLGSGLPRARVLELLDHARDVMGEALEAGGTSFDALYVDVDGESGYFARSLNAYGLAGHPCTRCGTPIVRERFMNRSSYFCPACQRRR
ncbi:bifunctional DNA-formamidopyrimidine glycosylase/DNA-(apurinic or apyrimidinic site) lyase [Agilicoccus flavus]|uniref:bifunctional DNA-formamidopyrimidine glycosylase/DNA-(apurinic or apyrimidinic site) lyase n=1 Tax=Agilicoccus flavus TaxID=2775968 RepID=UPI001CF6061D|nr:bifunctional DNA-formamidopyrimidine glycosylase/DNA-(apurinic or apyrimidinic site) lyase [Agilicoccus flavus]